MKRSVTSALILMGFTSLVVQALLIREFLISFYGNELTIGIILACWIIAEAIGSGFASKISTKSKTPHLTYGILQILICIYLPISIFLIRSIKNIFSIIPGEAVGIIPIVVSCIFIIGPLSIFDGMQFPFGCRLYPSRGKGSNQVPGKVYILEGIGFILAGPIFTYVFLLRFHSFQIGLFLGILNLVSAFLLAKEGTSSLLKKVLRFTVPLLAFFVLLILFSGLSDRLHERSISNQLKGLDVAEYKNSIYGNIVVSKEGEQYTFYNDGMPIITIPEPDLFWTEELIHFGLLSHPAPETILFLGSGAGGPITEALKQPAKRIDYVQLDPLLIELLKKYPKAITTKELTDPRVNLKITDGIRFVKETREKYDAIFINLPFPSSLQLNRYYTKEFFAQTKAILSSGGQLILALPGSLSYINDEMRLLNLCILRTLEMVFPDVSVIPGDKNIYIASNNPINITPNLFMKRLKERNIQTSVLTKFHLEYRLQKDRQDWFYKTLGEDSVVRENKNLTPAGLFYGLSYWSSLFNPKLRKIFQVVDKLNFNYFLLCIAIIGTVYIVILNRKGKNVSTTRAINLSIFTTGFIGMSFDLILILSYQVFFGYVYHHIALLVTSFMAGLTFGGWIINRDTSHFILLNRIKWDVSLFIKIEVAVLLFCLGCGIFLVYLNGLKQFNFYPIFFILSGISGMLVGSEFPLANHLSTLTHSGPGPAGPGPEWVRMEKTAGRLYALDLLGAFFAALVVSVIFIPIFGVLKTCLLLALLKAINLTLYRGTCPQG